ncbi:hypothetical protein GCM10028787_31410 [Brachybacterium horti]
MAILERLTAAGSAFVRLGAPTARARKNDLTYGPALALGYPARGNGWYRPWGRIETTMVSTRKSRRTLSVQNTERHIAILTSKGLTPEILSSGTWRHARNLRRGRITDAFGLPFAAVLIVGALLLGTVLHPIASLLAALLLVALAIAAGIVGILRYRGLAEQADADLAAAGHTWREIELGEDDAIARLVQSLDALSYSWEQEKVSESVWSTARELTLAVAEEARSGALIDDDNHELRTARDYIAAARQQIATTGRADDLTPKTT